MGGIANAIGGKGGVTALPSTGAAPSLNIPNVPSPSTGAGTVMPMFGANVPGNINQAAAGGIRQAMGATAANLANPLQQANITAYQNPYTAQVIGTTAMDLERQRQMMQNQIGAQATAAGAFGGSREAIERAATNEAFMRNLAQTAAPLRQQSFTQAQAAAQQDIQNRLAAGSQLANIANLGFGMGQTVQENLAAQGAMQQALQQQLYDAAASQYAGYQGIPQQGLSYLTSALSASPVPQSSTSSQKSSPGLLDVASTGATIYTAIAL